MKYNITSHILKLIDPKIEIHYCDYISGLSVGHECGQHAMVYINWEVKTIARNNRWITTTIHRYFCKDHLPVIAAEDTAVGQVLRSERLRIVVLTGMNVCEKVE